MKIRVIVNWDKTISPTTGMVGGWFTIAMDQRMVG
jgi:hypothetical protein